VSAREWEQLSLDEKLTELGFGKDTSYDQPVSGPTLTATEVRLHAALDQLMDAGGLLNEIEVMVKPAATGVVGADIPGEMLDTLRRIHELIAADDDE
jgi:hypothetical protein